MKVLYLALGRDLANADAGTTHTLSMAEALASTGVEVTVAARGAGARAAAEGVTIVEVETDGRPGALMPERALEGLTPLAREADVIQERAEESGGAGVRLAKAAARPLILEINTPLSGHPNPLLRRVADANLRRQARRASAIITQTPLAKAIIEQYARAQVFVVPNGADGEVFRPDVEPAPLPEARGRRVIAFAGSLRPWHGVPDLIEAAATVLARRPEAFFLMVGGGKREEEFRGLAARRLPAGGFHFTGAVEPSRVPAYLAAAEVLAAPFSPGRDRVRRRQFEKHGMWWSPVKIFEYMAMGRPIVSAAAGMIPEYLAGAGLTYPPGDAAALAAAIERMLDERELAASLAAAARAKLLANYTWRAAAERTAAAWRAVIAGGQKVSVTE